MAILGSKNPVLNDLDKGIMGTFVRLEKQGTEEGYVYPWFVPFNSLKAVRYTSPVPKSAIHHLHGVENVDGAEADIVYIFEGGPSSLMNFIDQKNLKLIEELKDQIKDLQVEKSSAKQRAEDAFSGAQKIIKQTKEINEKPKSPLDDLGVKRSFFEDGL